MVPSKGIMDNVLMEIFQKHHALDMLFPESE